jgi:enhancing lycopene biosynthesis protein 2
VDVWAQAAMGATEKMMEVMGTSHVLSRIQQVVVDSKRRNKLLEIANEIARINPNDKSHKQ